MFKIILERFRQKHRTSKFPTQSVTLPTPYRGRPFINHDFCHASCNKCQEICPTQALEKNKEGKLSIDLSRCLFCLECKNVCLRNAIQFSQDYQMATHSKKDLVLTNNELILAQKLEKEILSLFGRSLKLRQVSAGGCNACEADCNVLGTPAYDLGRFGIQFVASPRHADGLLITGPVSDNMKEALLKTYEALPTPRIVIAVGACALSGGIFRDHEEVHNGVEGILPVDLFIPGCPPHPMTILDGLLRLIGKIKT